MWPFKKRTDPVSLRLSGHSSDISVLYQRVYHLEITLAILELEVKNLKQQLLKNQGKIEITVTDCKRL